jgi:hypothetical protein
LFHHQAACVYDPRKLKPRGAAERQDFSELRSFLDAHPARPEDRAQTYEPKSDFEWEDTDDDEDDSKVRVNPRKHKQQHKYSTKDRGSGGGGSRGFEGVLGGVSSNVGEGGDDGNLEAGESGAGTEFMSGGGPATYDFGVTSTATETTDVQSAATSLDMMKAFNDPVWNRWHRKLTLQ